jgi:hypothetical protein
MKIISGEPCILKIVTRYVHNSLFGGFLNRSKSNGAKSQLGGDDWRSEASSCPVPAVLQIICHQSGNPPELLRRQLYLYLHIN